MKNDILRVKLDELKRENVVDDRHIYFILDNYTIITYMSEDKFCYECNYNKEDLAVLLKTFGFANYKEFQDFLKEFLEENQDDENRLENQDYSDVEVVVEELVKIEISNIEGFKNSVDKKNIDKLVKDMMQASEVLILGTRASSPIVDYATYLLNKVGKRTTKVDSSNTNDFDKFLNIDRKTLVLAIGFPRYPKGTVSLMRFLKERGFKIVAITDFIKSPLVNLSEYAILVKTNSYSFTDSYSAVMLLINAVVILLSKHDKEDANHKLKNFDEIANHLNYFI